MAQLKNKDGTREAKATCLETESGSGGFAFHFNKGIRMFAHHSFLMRIEMKNENEICFYYSYGVVRVTGRKLEMIYNLAVPRILGGVRLTDPDDPCRAEIEVREIVFEDAKDASSDGP